MVWEKSYSLHLVKNRIVTGVYLISPIHISSQKEAVEPRAHQLFLMGGGVRPQHVRAVQVVIVSFFSTGMVWRNEQAVKVLLHRHYRAEVVMYRKARVSRAAHVRLVEMVFDAFFNKPQGMVRTVVKLAANFGQDFRCHVGHVISRVDMAQNFDRVWANSGLRGAICGQPP